MFRSEGVEGQSRALRTGDPHLSTLDAGVPDEQEDPR